MTTGNVFRRVRDGLMVAMLSMICTGCGVTHGCGYGWSEGWRDGTIIKFSKVGMMNISWEGQISQEALKSRAGGVTTVWEFSCIDPSVAKLIEAYAASGRPLRMHYQEKFYNGMRCESRTPYLIVKVEPAP